MIRMAGTEVDVSDSLPVRSPTQRQILPLTEYRVNKADQ